MNVFIVEDAPKTRKELANLLADERALRLSAQPVPREALVGIEATYRRRFFWTSRCQTVAASKSSNLSGSMT
jgi:hypothetical protein